jgi:acetyl esterase/lipase
MLFLTALVWGQPWDEKPVIPDSIAVDANVAYDQHKETVLDVYHPKAPATAKRPGLIVIHGGGWVGGEKEGMIAGFVLPYLEQGFVVANVEYRLAGVAKAPAAVTDVLYAAQWFIRNASKYNVDRKRIVVTGASAGGHLALMAGMTPKSAKLGPAAGLAAVVNIYGITDVEDQIEGQNQRDYAVTWLPEQPGRQELARRLSPMTYVRKDLPAILTIHGDADETVPYDHGYKLTKAIREAGGEAQLISVPQGKHGFTKEQWTGLLAQTFAFLKARGILR